MAGVLGTEADDGGVGLSPPWLDEIDCEVGWGAAFYLLPISLPHSCIFELLLLRLQNGGVRLVFIHTSQTLAV